ncbi:MAG: ATP-binding protein [Rhizomicrobium sp.]
MPSDAAHAVDYRVLFEQAPGLFMVLDIDFRVLAITDAYCHLARVRRDEVLGRRIFEMFADLPERPGTDAIEKLTASLERTLRLQRPDAMATRRFDPIWPEESGFLERYWSVMHSPILDEGGAVRWILHRIRDITRAVQDPESLSPVARLARDQEATIARLRAANEELASIDRLRAGLLRMSRLSTVATMASALAHEVAQPLAAARNYLAALKRYLSEPDAGDKVSEIAEKLSAQIDRAGDVVKSLRRYMESGRSALRREGFAVVVADAVRLSQGAIRDAGATVEIHVDAILPDVRIDRVQIQQVLVNLIANAAEAVRGCAERRIVVSARADTGGVRVDLADTGVGLPPEAAARLLHPYEAGRTGGLGLGLPICRQILEEHGGKLSADRNAPAGTVFFFTLPIAGDADGAATPM